MAQIMSKYLLAGVNGSTAASSLADVSLRSTLLALSKLACDDFRNPAAVIVADLDKAALQLVQRYKAQGVPAVLVRNEPHVVAPWNYSPRNIALFDYIVDFGRFKNESSLVLPWPQVWPKDWESYATSNDRLRRAVVINANKLSLFGGELYSLRRRVIDSGYVDFFGPNWDSDFMHRLRILLGETLIWIRNPRPIALSSTFGWFRKHAGYSGVSKNKLQTLSNYKVAFVAENSREYMSEKLLDVLFAGCVPVYVGPPVARFGIPEGLVIEVEPNVESVKAGIDFGLSLDRELWLSKLEAYLRAEGTKEYWSSERVLQDLVSNLDSWFENENDEV